jgi:2-amino-4-hydroxy-6-hydroxymethyldihydropteridine diphosphokinase
VTASADRRAPPDRRAPLVRVAIALGSNLGPRRAHLAWAVRRLTALLSDCRVSPFETTAPVEVPDRQPDYLNAVAVGRTTLSPRGLLEALLALEAERGRVRHGVKAARTLDLDLILYGNQIVAEPGLSVPHPRFRERPFVLRPLAALAPRWRDPVTERTVADLWRAHRLPERRVGSRQVRVRR